MPYTDGNAETGNVTECPKCGSRMFNLVSSIAIGNSQQCVKVYYCMDCLHEFTKGGKIIEPLWEGMESR